MLWILVIVLSAACIALGLYVNNQKKSKLIAEGKIVDRKNDFTDKAEEFTLTVDNKVRVTEGIKNLPYGDMSVSMSGSEENQAFSFNGGDFKAQLWLKEERDGKSVYEFNFTSWKTVGSMGAPSGFYRMSMLLTAIEKMFLSIDSNTQVKTWYLDIKRKMNWI